MPCKMLGYGITSTQPQQATGQMKIIRRHTTRAVSTPLGSLSAFSSMRNSSSLEKHAAATYLAARWLP